MGDTPGYRRLPAVGSPVRRGPPLQQASCRHLIRGDPGKNRDTPIRDSRPLILFTPFHNHGTLRFRLAEMSGADPKRVIPQSLESPKAGARMTLKLPARSYSVLSVAL